MTECGAEAVRFDGVAGTRSFHGEQWGPFTPLRFGVEGMHKYVRDLSYGQRNSVIRWLSVFEVLPWASGVNLSMC